MELLGPESKGVRPSLLKRISGGERKSIIETIERKSHGRVGVN